VPIASDRQRAKRLRSSGPSVSATPHHGANTRGAMHSASSETPTALGIDRCVVKLEVVIEGGLIGLSQLAPMEVDVGRGLHLLLGHLDLEIVGTYVNSAKRHKGQVASDEALFDRGKLRYVGLDIDETS
jgi:hypothetical protein